MAPVSNQLPTRADASQLPHRGYMLLFGADIVTMEQFMWQLNIVGVAHFVMDCLDYLDAATSSNQP